MSRTWFARTASWCSTHHGVISSAHLRRVGATESNIRRLVASGDLIRICHGVYRTPFASPTALQVMSAACQGFRQVHVGFVSACSLWGFRGIGVPPRVHVLVDHPITPSIDGLVIHRCRRIDPIDVVERDDGIRLTSPPRSLFDAADMIGFERCASALEQLLDKFCGFDTVVDTVARLGHPRRPGTRTMTAVTHSRPRWQQAMQSGLEVTVMQEIAAQKLPIPVTQHAVQLPGGRSIRFDFAWPDYCVALEVDHPAWHDGAAQSHRDKSRDRKAATIGWTTIRITDFDVNGALPGAIADVGRVLCLRGLVLPAHPPTAG